MSFIDLALFLLNCGISIPAVLALTPAIGRVARSVGLVDRPNARTVHREPIPRVGGIAIVAASMLPLVLTSVTAPTSIFLVGNLTLEDLLLAAGGIFFVGLLDDVFNLSSKIKLVAIALAASYLWSKGARIDVLYVGPFAIDLSPISWLVAVLVISGVTVAVNFIDGLDGLAAGISAIALINTAVIAGVNGQPALAFACVAITGSLLGFLYFNFNPARIFMGDCGSMFLGFVLGSCVLIIGSSAQSAGSTIGVLLSLGVPLADVAFTMVRRKVLQRRSVFAAERGHIHHQLLDRGLSHKQVVLLLYAITAVLVGLAMIGLGNNENLLPALTLAGVGVVLVLFYRAGSIHPGQILQALRRNQGIARDHRNHRASFEQMQLRFRNVTTFDAWWDELCYAAGLLNLRCIVLPLGCRDGVTRVQRWDSEKSALEEFAMPPLTAVIPIRHRRIGAPLEAQISVTVGESLEEAGQCMALFSRLVEEHSLATLPLPGMATEDDARARRDSNRRLPVFRSVSDVSLGSTNGSDSSLKLTNSTESISSDRRGPGEMESPVITSNSRIAVVHDFLYTYAGAERVLEQILNIYPKADLFSLFDFLPPNERGFIGGRKVRSSFIQYMPMARTKHRSYLPFMPIAIEQLDVSNYDLVISSSYVAAKGIITRPDQLHVCYCHSPVRFAWDLQQQYLEQAGMTKGIKSMVARAILHYIRNWDTRCANGVDKFLTNSDFVGRRVEKVYRRGATTIYPPVDTENFTLHTQKDDYYLTVSRMVPYKKIDLIVEAFGRMPNKRLIVIGVGPDEAKIRARAPSNVRFMGFQPFEMLRHYMQRARAFVFAAEEDFGIVPTEAQACGTPVIAFGRGGVTESVIPGVTGYFFDQQTCESIVDAIRRFEAGPDLNPLVIRKNAERFSVTRFREHFQQCVEQAMADFKKRNALGTKGLLDEPTMIDIQTEPFVHFEPVANGNGNGNANGNGNGAHALRA